MLAPKDAAHIVLIGVGATAVMDIWLLLLLRLKVPMPSFALMGRWVGNMTQGKLHTRPSPRLRPSQANSGLAG